MQNTSRLNLFPLGIVLFPGLPLPLHIFEDRYKVMVRDCMKLDQPFGIVLADSRMRKIGCTARVEDVIKRYDDGRLDIVTRGERKFRVLEVENDEPYLVGNVTYIEESEPFKSASFGTLLQQTISRLTKLASLTGSRIDLESLRSMDPLKVSYMVAALDAFTVEEKQLFLELASPSQRLLACVQSLASVVQAYNIPDEAKGLLPDGKLLHRFN